MSLSNKVEAVNKTVQSAFLAAIVALLVLPAAAFLAVRALAPPRVVPAEAPASEFSAERALGLLKLIAAEPHPMGTPAHDRVRDTILQMWRDLGYQPEIQSGILVEPEDHFAARVENILARLPGTKPTPGGAVMLAAHYDSVEPSFGAADAGSGVVTLLETARALKAGTPLAEDLIFLITDGEEDGLLGARLFKYEHPWSEDVGLALNFEARGTGGPSLMFETSAGNGRLISALAAAPHPRAFSFSNAVYRSMPNSSDLSIWLNGDMQGLNFAFIGRPYDYHTAADSLAHLDLRSLQHHGSSALALARHFGSGGVPARTRRDTIHFSLFGDILVRYSWTTAALLAGLGAALLIAAVRARAARQRLCGVGILRGALFVAAASIVSAGLGYGLLSLVRIAHRSTLPAGPWPYSGSYFLGLVFLAGAATTALYGVLKSRLPSFEIAVGASAFLTTLGVAVTALLPDASYLLVWPSLFLSVAVFLWSCSGRSVEDTAPSAWIAAPAAAGVVLIAVPLLVLLFQAMFLSPVMAGILAAVVSIMLAAMAPALEVLRRGLGRTLPLLFAGLFLVVFAVSAATVRYSDRIPRAVSLQYLEDFDAGRAYWMTVAGSPDAWTDGIAGGGPFLDNPQPEYFGDRYAFRAAPLSEAAPPEVHIVEDRASDESRFLRLRVVSARGGRRISVSCETEGLRSAALEGRPLVLIPQNAKGFGATVLNPGPDGFELSLETAAASAVRVTVREYNPGFPALPGFAPLPPPSGVSARRIGVHLTKSALFPPPVAPGAYWRPAAFKLHS